MKSHGQTFPTADVSVTVGSGMWLPTPASLRAAPPPLLDCVLDRGVPDLEDQPQNGGPRGMESASSASCCGDAVPVHGLALFI